MMFYAKCHVIWLIAAFTFHMIQTVIITPHQVTHCLDKSKTQIYFDPIFSKLNKTHTSFSGNVTFRSPLDDAMMLTFDISRRGPGNKWSENVFNMKFKKACSDLRRLAPAAFPSFWKAVAGANYTSCPIPKGSYYLKNFIPYLSIPLPTSPLGEYKGKIRFLNSRKERIVCLELIIHFSN